jgi:uncharacterized protein with NRDE domain
MCLILLAYRYHPQYPLIIAANRDEFHHRPTEIATFWQESPAILAGRDLQSGGTWLGINRLSGKIAAVTNYRQWPMSSPPIPLSRGHLVSHFLQQSDSVEDYLQRCEQKAFAYQGFNLIVGSVNQLYYYSNRHPEGIQKITSGLHGLSNRLLDTPWPKVQKGVQGLRQLLTTTPLPPYQMFFELLYDTIQPPDEELPATGVTLEQERLYSSLFIINQEYGTRSSSLVLVDQTGHVDFLERSFTPTGEITQTVHIELQSSHFKLDV